MILHGQCIQRYSSAEALCANKEIEMPQSGH